MLINCDMGESYGAYKIGNDEALFPYIDACNIACGFHGGDPYVMEQTIENAIIYDIKIGAHPSYPDLQGFGRRKMAIDSNELIAIVKYQVAALKGMVNAFGKELYHVKPHGALYHAMNTDADLSKKLIEAILSVQSNLVIIGFAGSVVAAIAESLDISFLAEAFADRAYRNDGQLVSRNAKGAIIHDPKAAKEQVRLITEEQKVRTIDHQWIPIHAQTICIHGDHTNALEIAKAIRTV